MKYLDHLSVGLGRLLALTAETTRKGNASPLLLVLVIGALMPARASALEPRRTINQYAHCSWTSQHGLLGGAVYQIIQSTDGYLWLRTADGLIRFDGARFLHIDPIVDGKPIRDPAQAICRGVGGDLLIRGLETTLQYRDGKFSHRLPPAPLEKGNARNIFEASDGQIWVGGDAYLHRAQSKGFELLLSDTGWINAFLEDQHDNLWVGGYRGLYRFRNGKFDSSALAPTIGIKGSVTALIKDGKGAVLVGTHNGLYRLVDDKLLSSPEDKPLALLDITALFEDRNGNLWVGTDSAGLFRRADGLWTSFAARDGLSDDGVLSLCEDKEGSVWVGTRSGLDQFRDTKLMTVASKEGVGHDNTVAVLEARDGSTYIFSQGGGLTRLKDGVSTVYTIKDGLASNNGTALFESKDGSLWIGTEQGLTRFKDGEFTIYDGGGRLAGNTASVIFEDDESLLVGVAAPPRVYRFHDGVLSEYRIAGRPTPFSTEDIYVISALRDNEGTTWLATTWGLYKMPKGGPIGDGRQSTAMFTVTCIHDDGQGCLWLGGKTEGLSRYRIADGLVTRFTSREGVIDDEISKVLEDSRGNLWMSTRQGIVRVSRADLNAVADGSLAKVEHDLYGTLDGMKAAESSEGFHQPAGWKARDGRLWFATRKGVVVIDREHLFQNRQVPPVLIEEVISDQRSQTPDQVQRFAAGTDRFEFRFTALSLRIPERVRFRYRLEGMDADWVDAGTLRTASYTRLPPGQYRFRVVACNDDGIWNLEGASVNFVLEPYFYQTMSFYVLCIALLSIVVAGGHLVRTRQLRAHETYLARCVEDGTGQLRREMAEHAKTGEQLRQAQKMEAVGQLASGVAHDFNNLLTIINGYTEVMLGQSSVGDPRRRMLVQVQKAGERAASLTSQLLTFTRQQVVAPRILDLNDIVVETKEMLARMIGEEVILDTQLSPNLCQVRADAGQMHQVLMNLAVNARDAMSGGGRLTIETRNAVADDEFARAHPAISPGPYVVLAVTDTGCGMTPEITDRIFEPFFTTKDVGKGTGLGLATVYGIAQQSGGCVVVRSEPGHGTTFELYLPCLGETPKAEEPAIAPAAAPSGNGTILLVEDESQVRAVMRSMLETSGYEVLEAANGQEAIRVISNHGKPVQLLVSDVVMPDMGGRQAAEALRAIQPGLRVLFVSGYTGDDIVHDGVLKFDFGFLQKPFTPSALADAVRGALNG